MDAFVPLYSRLGEGFNSKQIAKADEHPGRRVDGTQSAATWIVDLVGRRACILLCSFCRVKFSPRKFHYRRMYVSDYTGMTDGHTFNGRCDACKQPTVNSGGGAAFVHEEEYSKTCVDPVNARREARAKSRDAFSAWSFIQNQKKG